MGRHVRRRYPNRVGASVVLALAAFALTTSQPALHGTAATTGPLASPEATRLATTGHLLPVPPPGDVAPDVEAAVDRSSSSVRLSSPKGTRTWSASALSEHGVPAAAMRAYRHAAVRLRGSDPSCRLPWTLLAGIGRVESDHGRYGGATLARDGVSHPSIIGMRLDGTGPVAAIRDTDRGRLDGDRVWDRAVGPMQFIPGTWTAAAGDGDGDGVASPHDLDDAALAAATYLCSGSASLAGEAAMSAAVYRYNQDDYYVALVLAFERGYRTGVFTLPSPPADQDPAPAARHPHGDRVDRPGRAARHQAEHGARDHGRHDVGAHRHRGVGDQHGMGNQHDAGTAGPRSTTPGGQPAKKQPSGPAKPPAHKPADKPAEKPADKPKPPVSASPDPGPTLTALTGGLTACAAPSGWCVGATGLDLGKPDLSGPASADFDADGSTETLRDELDGLAASSATDLLVEVGGSGVAVVYVINGHGYRNADGTLA